MVWAFVFVYLAVKALELTARMSDDVTTSHAKAIGNIVDIFSNIQNVKFYSNEDEEIKRVSSNFARAPFATQTTPMVKIKPDRISASSSFTNRPPHGQKGRQNFFFRYCKFDAIFAAPSPARRPSPDPQNAPRLLHAKQSFPTQCSARRGAF